jgi:hypothetical protein
VNADWRVLSPALSILFQNLKPVTYIYETNTFW